MKWWTRIVRCFRSQPENSTPNPTAIQALDEFWPMFQNSRSLCGYLSESLLGANYFIPGPFYQEETPYACVQLKKTLTDDVRQAHNRIGAWTNENCLVRLWAILESHGYTKPIREHAEGADTVKLLKQLRQHFAHGTGLYDDHKKAHQKLRRDLLRAFPLPGDPQGIPLDIDRVLLPMFKRCRQYVDDVLRQEHSA